jgi:hypothetical protein
VLEKGAMRMVTRDQVIELILRLSEDKLASVYDFAHYIEHFDEVPDFLRSTDEEMRAEDASWDAAFERVADKIDDYVDRVLAEEPTTDIDANGEVLMPRS